MNINLELYKTFYYVAKNKSMSKAAQELLISQPAISKAITNLENELGSALFLRSNKGLTLTKEGETLFEKIKQVMFLINDVEQELVEYKDLNSGVLRIGISTVLTKVYLLDKIESFREKFPKIKIEVINGLTNDLINKLNEGKLDFVIYNDGFSDEDNVEKFVLEDLQYVFFYNKKYISDKIKTWEDLQKYPIILQNKNSNTRKFLDFKLKSIGIDLIPSVEVVSQDLICEFVKLGLGIGFAYENLVKRNYKDLTIIKTLPKFETKINLALNKNLKKTFATKKFMEEVGL